MACDGQEFTLTGRRSVFTRVTDFAYVPRDAEVTVSSAEGGRFALPAARATRRLTARYGPAEGVAVELRGAGQASRQVNNFCTPATFDADKLIAVEVLTPGSNWSSLPAAQARRGPRRRVACSKRSTTSRSTTARRRPAWATSASTPRARAARSTCAPRCARGDTVLVPHGWHGPSMATPGYHLYYLNVMAGPGDERAWRICDDPAHAWVRGTWDDQEIDPRLPLTTTEEQA